MSQFQSYNNQGGSSGYDPVSALSNFGGNPFDQPGFNQSGPRQNRSPAPKPPTLTPPTSRSSQSGFQPRTNGIMGNVARAGSLPRTTTTSGINPGYLRWDAALAGAMGTDIRNQQGEMNRMFGAGQKQIGMSEDALQRGIGTMQSVGAEQRQNFSQMAGGLEQQGQKDFEGFTKYRDEQMGRVDKDISAANQQAAGAVSGYEQAIGQFKDTGAQDAANAAFGMRRNIEMANKQIDAGLNADGSMMSPAEKQAARQQLYSESESQVSQAVTGIYSNMNQQVASMQGNLAGLRTGQAQQTLAGGQLRGQIGTTFGAQTLDAQQTNYRMKELGSNLRTMGEQAYASAMQQSVMFEMQGRQTMAQMVRENPRQFVSMFAGLTGFLAGATTPGLRDISIPNFGAMT